MKVKSLLSAGLPECESCALTEVFSKQRKEVMLTWGLYLS